MRAPNVQLFTNQLMSISGITDGAYIAIFARNGDEIFDGTPEADAHVPVNEDQYPVTICVSKEGYTALVLTGLIDGSLVQQVTPEVT